MEYTSDNGKMSTKLKDFNHLNGSLVEVKSKFDAEFRRFAIRKFSGEKFEDLYQTLQRLHQLQNILFVIFYTDKDGDLLPINNNENYMKALTSPLTVLRISVQRKDENWSDLIGYSTLNRKKDAKNKLLGQMPHSSHSASKNSKTTPLKIGMPEDFRQVSAIIDVDILPQTLRRVRLLKHGSDRPLGFYIRDGNSVKVTPTGIVRVPGIFISRLVPGGLAESTGLLSVEDEIVEVNGIEVAGKTLDQVTDMMIANSSNLIITVKPANQRLTQSPSSSDLLTDAQLSRSSPAAVRNTHQRMSQMSASAASTSSFPSNQSYSMEEDDDMDEIRDLTAGGTMLGQIGNNSGSSGTGSDRPSSSSSTTARRESVRAMRPITNGLHVTKIIIDGKSNGIIHENEQVFTL